MTMFFLWLVGILAIGAPVSGHGKWSSVPGRNLKEVNCRKVKQANLCHSCCKDPCESVNCLNGGKYVRGICECTSGYSGPNCGVGSCNNRCLNNATCNNGICDCPPMFSGEYCGTKIEPVDLCANVTCLNDGQCRSGVCKCIPGYDGEDCSVNLCAITNCPRETRPCVPTRAPGGYTCSCVKRTRVIYYGDDECRATSIISPVLYYDNNLNVTTTIPGVPGKNLTISFIEAFDIRCAGDYLEIGGTRYCGQDAPADITLPTGDGTPVRFVTDKTAAAVGYILTYQYIDAEPDSNPCKNGGTPNAEETCNCMPGFQGINCEFPPILTSGGKYDYAQELTFFLPGFPEKELVLTFVDDFSIATTNGNCNDIPRTNCTVDYVEIEFKRYCGGMAPGPITIPTGRGTRVDFASWSNGCPTGFRLTYVYRDP